jgi:predicted O-methyltransferase YrrM
MIEGHLEWLGPQLFEVGGVRFRLALPEQKIPTAEEREAFVILKDAQYIADYIRLFSNERLCRVMEFGIYVGGSAIFMQKLWRIDKIVGIDICPQRRKVVEQVAALGLSEHIRLHFEVDQADAPTVEGIFDAEFAGQAVDMIIDDASHDLVPTTRTFLTSFPRLRPGGWYVIEDWAWGFRGTPRPQTHHRGSLRHLVNAIVLSVGRHAEPSISQIVVTRRLVALQRAVSSAPLRLGSIEALLSWSQRAAGAPGPHARRGASPRLLGRQEPI